MKKLSLFLLAFVLMLNCFSQSLPSYLPSSGLVAWYPFNGNANDESGNGNNGVVNGAVTLTADRNGRINNAYNFTGGNITVPYSNTIGVQEKLTISVWLLMNGGGCNPRVLEINSVYNQCGGYSLATNGTSNSSRTFHTANLGNCTNGVGTGTSPNLSALQWHHIVYTVDGNIGVGNIYFDDSLVYTYSGTIFSTINYNNNPLTIGNINSGRCDWWGGYIDDIAIYNRVLTQQEITQLYTNSTSNNCVANILNNDTTICSGSSINLTANASSTSGSNSNCFTPKVLGISNTNFGLNASCKDNDGNIFVTGAYTGNTNIGNVTLSGIGGRDVFLAKYNSCGVQQWALRGGSSGNEDYAGVGTKSIATDASGNIFIVGRYNQTFTFYGNNSTSFVAPYTATSNGNHQDGYLIKINPNGEILWGATLRGGSNDGFNGVAIDNAGNPIVTGGFNGCCPSTFAVTIYGPNGSLGVNSFGSNYGSGLLVKFDSNGNILWKSAIYNRDTDLNRLAIDQSNNIYVTSGFRSWNNGTAGQFIDANGTNNSLFNPGIGLGFLVKLNSNGIWQWGTTFGNTGDGVSSLTYGTDVTVDNDGNPWISGFFRGATATFYTTSGSTLSLPASTNDIGFIAKYSAAGVPLLVNSLQQSTGSTYFNSIAIANDTIAVAGFYTGNNLGSNDMLLAKYNTNAVLESVKTGGGSGDDQANSVVANGTGFIVSGTIGGASTIDGVGLNSAGTFLWNNYSNGGSSSSSYLWSTGATTSSISVSPTVTTKYFCTVSNGNSSCVDSVTVYVSQPSTSTIEISTCSNYAWNGVEYTNSGVYTFNTTNAAGCDSIATLNLTITSLNPNVFDQDTIRACGTSSSLDAGSGYSSYSWNTGETAQSISVSTTGWYKCVVNNGDCEGVDSVFVSIVDANIVNGDTAICQGASVTLNALSTCSGIQSQSLNWELLIPGNSYVGGETNFNQAGFDQSNRILYSVLKNGSINRVYAFDLVNKTVSSLTSNNAPGELYSYAFDNNNNRIVSSRVGRDVVYSLPINGGTWQQIGSGGFDAESYGSNSFWNPISSRFGYFGGYGFFSTKNWIWENNGSGWLNTYANNNNCNLARRVGNQFAKNKNGTKYYVFSGQGSCDGNQFASSCSLGSPWPTDVGVYCWLRDIWELDLSTYQFTNILPPNSQSILREGSFSYDYSKNTFYIIGGNAPTSTYGVYTPYSMEVLKYNRNTDAGFSAVSTTGTAPSSTSTGLSIYDSIGNRIIYARADGIWALNLGTNCANTYLWSNSASSTSTIVSPEETTKYYVTISNGISSCVDSVTVYVSQPSTSTTDISSCSNYSWNGVEYTNSGNYTFNTTNALGCDSIAKLNLTITTFSPNVFDQDTILACGTSYSLDAGAGYNFYSWNTGETSQSINVTITGWYKCKVTTSSCLGEDSVFVSLVNANILNSDTVICIGSSIELSVFESSNGIDTTCWQQINAPQNNYLHILKANNGTYLVSTYSGGIAQLYNTNDPNNWENSSNPLPNGLHLMSGKTQSGKLFISSSHNGVYTSIDNGSSWSYVFGNGYGCAALDFQESNPGTLFISLGGYLRGIYKSTDNGVNWVNKIGGLDFTDIEWIQGSNIVFAQNTNGQLWKSSDMGETWIALSNAPFYGSAGKVESIGSNVWVFSINGSVYRSNDQGTTWALVVNIPFSSSSSVYFNDFIIDQQGTWWLGMNSQGIWRSTNSGSAWINAGDCLTGEFRYFFLNGSTLLATTSTGINKIGTTNYSSTWSTGENTRSIFVTPTQTTKYYCTVSNGISSCIDSVTIYVNQPSTSISNISTCNSYIWNSQTYSQSGTYTLNSTNLAGCDSMAILNLDIQRNFVVKDSFVICDNYFWRQNPESILILPDTGTIQYIIQSNSIPLTPGNAFTIVNTNGWNYPLANYPALVEHPEIFQLYSITFPFPDGVYPQFLNYVSDRPGNYYWRGQQYTQSGVYTTVANNLNECDTVFTLNLSINSSPKDTIMVSSCSSYYWNDIEYSESGVYAVYKQNEIGCDSSLTLILSIGIPTNSQETLSFCNNYEWNGQTYTQSGIYTWVGTNASGCDSTVTLNLTINKSTSYSEDVNTCDMYNWNGFNYTNSGIYTYTTTNAVGCDSVATLNLTITPSTSNTTIASSCDSYTWSVNGQTYTQSGTYSSLTGCNTEILNLTITPSASNTTTASSCDSYTWAVNGQVYTQSGSYTSITGCNTEVLNLTITPSTSNTTTASSCDSYTWSVNGQAYTQSGSYTSVTGCYTEVLNLTITPSTSNTTTASSCGSYQWVADSQSYTTSGNYTFVNGCNTQYLNLTINRNSVAASAANASSTSIASGTSVTLSLSGGSLGTGASWKWYSGSCGGTLVGTGTSISVSPTSTTTYFVRAEGTCNTTTCASVTVTVQSACGPTAVVSNVANNTICSERSVLLTVQGTLGSGASWKWYKNGCGNGSSIGSGNSITVRPSSTTTYFVRSMGGSCGTTSCKSITITKASKPSTPGSISGTASGVCNASGVKYSIAAVSGSTSYVWTVPTGATIVSGQGTTSITVNYGNSLGINSSCGSSLVCVKAVNTCGSSDVKCLSVSNLPNFVCTTITGPSTACLNIMTNYSCAVVNGATNYTWVLPTGWTIVSGRGTNSIVVKPGSCQGTIKVTPSNACGSGSYISKYVKSSRCTSPTYSKNEIEIIPESIKDVSVWPIPANSYINLNDGGLKANKIEIIDASGRLVMTTNWKTRLELGRIRTGIYILKIHTNEGVKVKRVEVMRF